ncbi:ornithine cyclodeaminase family protein [Lutimonas halocynthiae]|uniref:ornithine cyclodeaminase family protein n=1 Tax=Lutimonas halocynthiae TaxID=1446477 RepID=UPI0025B60543|nr:ornithine cyclodeaminase family protein [Lutimonas halocynthiae]MDN3642753.1 ornithine cyclodeaminase family protein [Lutimonas halocynthiae]
MDQIPFIKNEFMESHTDFNLLIKSLKDGFAEASVETPMRHHHDYKNPEEGIDSTLLLMPAWRAGNDMGVKIVTVNPNNGKYQLPAIQGTYLYMDGHKGTIRAILDAKALTAKRTAATSALAASYLAREDASVLLMIGTGALSRNLIKAHASIRPITKVYIWGRDYKKAQEIALDLTPDPFDIIAVKDYIPYLGLADIISCATLSKTPLVFGQHLLKGQHIDLVGAYKKDMREADDEAIMRSAIFLDTFQGGLKESGDIVIPIQNGVLDKKDIKADLFDLCSAAKKGRESEKEITFFKSVGHASEDLIAAKYYFEQW